MPTKNNKSLTDVHLCKLNILLNTQFRPNASEIFCNCQKNNKKHSKPYNRIGKNCVIRTAVA